MHEAFGQRALLFQATCGEPMEEWLRGPGADTMLRWRLLRWGLW